MTATIDTLYPYAAMYINALGTCGIVSMGTNGIVSMGTNGIVSMGTCGIISMVDTQALCDCWRR